MSATLHGSQIRRPPRPAWPWLAGALALVAMAGIITWRVTSEPAPRAAPIPARTLPPAKTGFPGGIASATGAVAPGFTRYGGRVTDLDGEPIGGVCVYAGPSNGCPSPGLVTDGSGRWAFDFPSGLGWDFNFEHPAYAPKTQVVPPPAQGADAITLDLTLAPRTP